ncbi:MAG: VOC family protein [Chloroflexota bacterium]
MMSLAVKDVKVFVPAKNFTQSRQFYKALGWQENWVADDGGLAELELAGNRFYLQNYYQQEWADNFMFHVRVEDATAWYEHVKQLVADGDYEGVRVSKPNQEGYGSLVTYVWDPSGVLLHFAQPLEA